MDNFIVRWYNQNRRIIWTAILTIVGIIALIQTLNNNHKNNPKVVSSTSDSTTNYNTNSYSIITRYDIEEETAEESVKLIEQFFEYCNNGKIEQAYNLLSIDCKETLYPTMEDFKSKYYNKIFTERKNYNSNLWITDLEKHTYRLEIMADLLATGKKDNMPIEDYYTIVEEEGQNKLNISRYVGKENINITKAQDNITVNIVSKKIYIDYEIYEIEVYNNSLNKLIFNTKENTDSIYIQDENELKYIAFLNEIPNSELEISSGSKKELEIKFNRGYKPHIDIVRITFKDIKSKIEIEKFEIDI